MKLNNYLMPSDRTAENLRTMTRQVKQMILKKSNTNKQWLQRPLSGLVLCMLVVCFTTGCQSKSYTTSDSHTHPDLLGLFGKSHNKSAAAKPPEEQLQTTDYNSAGIDRTTPDALPNETIVRDNETSASDINSEQNRTAATDNTAKIKDGKTIITEQMASETDVALPALNKQGIADELISVNFDQVDIQVVIKTIGDITGINFVVDDTVHGTISVVSPTKIRLGEVYKVLESILEVKGYAAVPAGDIVKIVPRAEAARRNLQVRVGSSPCEIPKNDSLVTQIIPLKYADSAEVSQIIKPLLATGAYIATYPKTNSILITDTSSNINHIAQIIQKFDVTGSKEQVTVIGLKYASAQSLSEQITHIMQKNSQSSRGVSAAQTETGVKILPDVRTNSLVVVANALDTKDVEALVKELDVQRLGKSNNIHVVYLKNAEAKEAAASLTSALANLKISGAIEGAQQVQVTADEGTNALIIAASAQDYEVIADIIEKLDIVREQVLVEMFIMEVSEDALTEIGIDWSTFDQAVSNSVRGFGSTNFGPRVDYAAGDLEGLSVGAWKKVGSNVTVGAILTALQKKSGVNILSTPHILTSNHHKAKIIVGENMPFVTGSRITETTDPATPTVVKTYEYKDVGITLEITPHISQGGLVRLEINSEFTKLIENVTTTSSSDTPTTAKRQAETVVSMNSGSTVVIGGLIRDDKVTTQSKIPLVGDLPLIGGLFRYQKDELQKTNLLIFITPYVMGDQADLERITEQKKKQMEPALKALNETTKDVNQE